MAGFFFASLHAFYPVTSGYLHKLQQPSLFCPLSGELSEVVRAAFQN